MGEQQAPVVLKRKGQVDEEFSWDEAKLVYLISKFSKFATTAEVWTGAKTKQLMAAGEGAVAARASLARVCVRGHRGRGLRLRLRPKLDLRLLRGRLQARVDEHFARGQGKGLSATLTPSLRWRTLSRLGLSLQ